ncbi:MAG: Ger(x)C family spore germination protein [Syntrophomonadaceae bacterium]
MSKKTSLVLMTLLFMLFAAGCWDARDISKGSVVFVAAIDLNQEGGIQFGEPVKYDATILMPNLYPESANKVRIEKVSGTSLSGSRDQRAYINPDIILVRMMRVFLVGESLAASGIAPVIDSLCRNPLIDNSLNMAMTTGRSGELITVQPQDFPELGLYLKVMLNTINEKSFFPVVTLHVFRTQSTTMGRNPVLPILKADNGEVRISGLGIFKKDQLINRIGLDESRPLALLRGCKGRAYIPYVITREGESVDRGTVFASNERKVKVERQGDQYTFTITITLKGDLIEHENRVQLLQESDYLPMVEEQIASKIEDECQAFIERMQGEFKVDCIDINKYALAKWRNELKDSIDGGFIEKVKINVDVKVNIRNTGDLT